MAKRVKGGQSTNLPTVPGRYSFKQAKGLYLFARSATAASWFYRFTATVDGRKVRRELGLGPAHGPTAVAFEDAQIAAIEAGKLVRAGGDPVAEKAAKLRTERAAERKVATEAITFWEVAEAHIEANRAGWKADKHVAQWEQSLLYHAKALHRLPVGAITTEHVLSVLRPIWSTKPETASRVRGRIEAVLDSAKVDGLRDGENPARWKGHLALKLPKTSKVRRVKHYAALPWRDVPAFMADLTEIEAVAGRALALTILTAVRTGEAIGARWSEIAGDVWIIPAERTKTAKEHRVPLSAQALAVLGGLPNSGKPPGSFIFPSDVTDSEGRPFPLSNMAMLMCLRRLKGQRAATVHGFRSSFRDWCADHGVPRELAEACLAHAAGGVERAYYRSDVIDLRRDLMQRWADFVLPAGGLGANVVPLAERRS
jgi:integrase